MARTTWGLLLLGILAGCGVPYQVEGAVFAPSGGALGELDLLVPEQGPAPRPGVLLLHPGGWNSGDKVDLDTLARRLAGAGFVVGNANYRLAPAVHFPIPLQDAWCALAYLRERAPALGLDPGRVAVLGYSAGANLAELMGLAAPGANQDPGCPAGVTGPPAAVVAGAGPADLLHLPSAGDAQVADYLGATKAEAPERYAQASPLAQLRAGAPPFLLIHGTADLFVPSEQSWAMRDGLEALGSPVRLLLLGGGGHSLNPGADPGAVDVDAVLAGPEAWAATLDFLRGTLGAPP